MFFLYISGDAKHERLRVLIHQTEFFIKDGYQCVHLGKKRRQDFQSKKLQNYRQNG